MENDAPKPPPRRARFQVHLSTAIVLMFVAGGLMWANVRGTKHPVAGHTEYGWPICSAMAFNREFSIEYYKAPHQDTPKGIYVTSRTYSEARQNPYIAAFINLMVALSILLFIHFICEWLIRRRSLKKGA